MADQTGSLRSRDNAHVAVVNINLAADDSQIRRFSKSEGQNLPRDHIRLCGGMADKDGKFVNSGMLLFKYSGGSAAINTQALDTGGMKSGSGKSVFYYDLCSSGNKEGVMGEARFQASLRHVFADGSAKWSGPSKWKITRRHLSPRMFNFRAMASRQEAK